MDFRFIRCQIQKDEEERMIWLPTWQSIEGTTIQINKEDWVVVKVIHAIMESR